MKTDSAFPENPTPARQGSGVGLPRIVRFESPRAGWHVNSDWSGKFVAVPGPKEDEYTALVVAEDHGPEIVLEGIYDGRFVREREQKTDFSHESD